jgi:predicted permease
MTAVIWRLVVWHLRRQVTVEQLIPVLGDLAEDLEKQREVRGPVGASVWLLREGGSVANAYRTRYRHDRRLSRRTIMGGSWKDDARLAWRRVIKHPAAGVAAVLTLACGIAGAAVTWSVLSAVLIHPLPVQAPEELVSLAERHRARDGFPSFVTEGFVYPTYTAIRDSGTFAAVGAGGTRQVLVGDGPESPSQRRLVAFVSHDYFTALGVRLMIGRPFTPGEDQRGASLAVVVSERYWRSMLNADMGVVGRTIAISGIRGTIVGVTPRGFRGMSLVEAPELYVPLHSIADLVPLMSNPFFDPAVRGSPSAWIRVVGRLRPGVTPPQAQARLDGLSTDRVRTKGLELIPVNTAAIPEIARDGARQFTRLLAITVALLLGIGCATIGLLLLLRTEARREEFAMCLALGGTRAGLARGIVIEGALLSLAGAALSIPIASSLFAGMRRFALPGQVEFELLNIAVDGTTIVAAGSCALAATLLISLVAGVFGFSPNIADVLRSKAGGTPRIRRRPARAMLIAAQVAVALVLVSGAVLFSRSLAAALTINPGFDAGRVATTTIAMAQYGYKGPQALQFLADVRERLEAAPDIDSATVSHTYTSMGQGGKLWIDGVPRQFPSEVYFRVVDDRYFSTMGMRVIKGRDFSPGDRPGPALVVLVSESFAKAIGGGSDVLGRRMHESIVKIGEEPRVEEIIGVVPDVIVNVADTQPLVKYYSLSQFQESIYSATVTARTRSDASAAKRTMLSVIQSVDPRVTPTPPETIQERLRTQMSAQELGRFVLGGLGLVAALLTVLGAYVLAESMSAMRRRELTIRGALGASRGHLGRLIIMETVWLVGAGLVAGALLAAVGASSIERFLFRIEPMDLGTLLAVSAAIFSTTMLVSLKPAFDAGRVDLNFLLRHE